MTRKLLLFTMLMFAALPVRAQELYQQPAATSHPRDTYCIPAEKLQELRTRMQNMMSSSSASPLTVNAYERLFDLLVAKNSSDKSSNTAGCITQQELAEICQSVWYNDIQMCEAFVYEIVDDTYHEELTRPERSDQVRLTDFSNIDSDIFNEAVNAAVDRRADKSVESKLTDTGSAFLDAAKSKEINPFLSVAIAMEETGRGTSAAARLQNNIGGLGVEGQGWFTFPSVEASIERQAKTLRKNLDNGLDNLYKLADSGKYCYTGKEDWYIHVRQILRELYVRYDEILGRTQQNIKDKHNAL